MKLNRLIPMLPVRSMPVSVEFYQNMLGFKVERRNDDWVGRCSALMSVD
jgi:catechol 2,3-dioxygenase-like lactoylglutathione lyase family enzyme